MKSRLQQINTYFNQSHRYLSQGHDIRFRAKLIREIAGHLAYAAILDLGCGDGTLSLQFQSKTNRITLVDISEAMLNIAGSKIAPAFKKNVRLIRSPIETLVDDTRFDLVIASGVLAHAVSVEAVIHTISRHMAPRGLAVIQLTDHDQWVSKLLWRYNALLDRITRNFTYKRNPITQQALLVTAKRHGLFPVDTHRYSLMLPGMNSLLPDRLLYDVHEQTHRNRFLNRLATDLMIAFSKNPPLA